MSERRLLLGRLPLPQRQYVLDALRQETVGGVLLLVAAALALLWANSPWRDSYHDLAAIEVGPAALHLNLSLAVWAGDGLLAVFFFVAGLELKHELLLGSLSDRATAALPIVAALCGMVVPALLYAATITWSGDEAAIGGWGIPMATDIAFALAVLAVAGPALPMALRAFLLTLAVVDDLGAIIVIALFYGTGFEPLPFIGAVGLAVGYALLQRRRVRSTWIYLPLAVAAWALMHAAGVHPTVAGVSLGLLTRTRPDPGETTSPADRLAHRIRPLSAGICVPLFAFFAAGVTVVGLEPTTLVQSPVLLAVLVGLVIGKPLGVYGGARLLARFTRAELSPALRWADVFAIGLLAGVGFTVSLLITDLAFYPDPERLDPAKLGVLSASVVAAGLAIVALRRRASAYREFAAVEEADLDQDGIPDVYQRDQGTG